MAAVSSQAASQQRKRFDSGNGETPCIPMQMANANGESNITSGKISETETSITFKDRQGRVVTRPQLPPVTGLRADCWNSPLCPRNMPQSAMTEGNIPSSCGSASANAPNQIKVEHAGDKSPPREVCVQPTSQPTPSSCASAHAAPAATAPSQQQQQQPSSRPGPTAKRSRTTDDDASPTSTSSPSFLDTPASRSGTCAAASAREKRLPHHVIERRYRENLNSQIEALRAAVPSTSSCLTLDMEDIGSNNASSAIRPMSKAAVIAHAAEYMCQLASQNEEVERMNRELRNTVEALRRLVNCEDCGVVRQIVDAGA